MFSTIVMLSLYNVFVFEHGREISKLVYNITDTKQKDKFKRRAKSFMIWSLINLVIPAITFFFILFKVPVDVLFELNGIIVISSLILIIYLFKCLKEIKYIKKFPLLVRMPTLLAFMSAFIFFTLASSIIKGSSNEIYTFFALLTMSLGFIFFIIWVFYSMFTYKPEEDKKIEEQKIEDQSQ